MTDLTRQLTDRFSTVFDNYQNHAINMDPHSIEDITALPGLAFEAIMTRWAAGLDIKTKHDLMKSSLEAIK
jgi:hypothetical protein